MNESTRERRAGMGEIKREGGRHRERKGRETSRVGVTERTEGKGRMEARDGN